MESFFHLCHNLRVSMIWTLQEKQIISICSDENLSWQLRLPGVKFLVSILLVTPPSSDFQDLISAVFYLKIPNISFRFVYPRIIRLNIVMSICHEKGIFPLFFLHFHHTCLFSSQFLCYFPRCYLHSYSISVWLNVSS